MIISSEYTNLFVKQYISAQHRMHRNLLLNMQCFHGYSNEVSHLHPYSYFFSTLADSLMEKFRALVPEAAAVIRDGVTKPIAATDIVIGDLIRLKSGR
jgi:magnesium-transporting ATPase (P-type)